MRVKDVMTKSVVRVLPETTVAEALDVMVRSHLSGLPVIDDSGSLVGVVSEADFLRRWEIGTQGNDPSRFECFFFPGDAAEAYARSHARRVDEIMSADVVTIGQNADLAEAAALMEKKRIKRLPVVVDGKVVGIVTRADFVRLLAEFVRRPYEEPPVSDFEIQERLEAELKGQAWAPLGSITIAVKDSVVTIGGVVTDERQHKAVRAAAENIYGVREVLDHISVTPPYMPIF
jgi:CBS domain-containing protein